MNEIGQNQFTQKMLPPLGVLKTRSDYWEGGYQRCVSENSHFFDRDKKKTASGTRASS